MEKLEQDQPLLSLSPTRCPYCHDEVAPAEFSRARVCVDCLARHHSDCWEGVCASCGSEHAMGTTTQDVERAGLLIEERIGAEYERLKRWGNRAAIVLFVLYFVLMFAGLAAAAALDILHQPTPPWTMIPGFVSGALLSLLLLPLPFLNAYDAYMRSRQDPSCGWVAFTAVALTWCTAGLSGMAYYLRWGWRPLPEPERRRRPKP